MYLYDMDENIKISELYNEVAEQINYDLSDLIFEFSNSGGITKLDLITVNPKHKQSFLYHSAVGISKLECLEKILEYIDQHRKTENSYTLQWVQSGKLELFTSYFRAHNIQEVLDKFSYGRDMNIYTIYAISLNPIS